MLLVEVDAVAAFDVLGVRVRPLLGRLELSYPDLDPAQFAAAMASRPPGAATSGRQGVVVEEPAGHVLPPHWHGVPQYQVFHGGDGRLGPEDVRPITIHYTDDHAPYGPIVAGPEGLAYAVLRPSADVGAHWMPAERSGVGRGRRRHFTLHIDLDGEDGDSEGAVLEPPLDDHPAAVEWCRLAPGADRHVAFARDPDTDTAVALVRGGLVAPVVVRAPAYGHPTDHDVRLRAGREGADLLFLRMPLTTPVT